MVVTVSIAVLPYGVPYVHSVPSPRLACPLILALRLSSLTSVLASDMSYKDSSLATSVSDLTPLKKGLDKETRL